MIIGIVGKKRSGKDTIADHLCEKHRFRKYSLALPMKIACKEIFLFDDSQMWGDKKEVIDERYGVTPRKILQVFGTELFQYDIYNHIPELENRFKLWHKENNITQSIVLSDIRFPHESNVIKELGGILIKVERETGLETDSHASELEMESIIPDFVIDNNGTIEELKNKINKVIENIHI